MYYYAYYFDLCYRSYIQGIYNYISETKYISTLLGCYYQTHRISLYTWAIYHKPRIFSIYWWSVKVQQNCPCNDILFQFFSLLVFSAGHKYIPDIYGQRFLVLICFCNIRLALFVENICSPRRHILAPNYYYYYYYYYHYQYLLYAGYLHIHSWDKQCP
jgi:hypothetical protein